MTVRSQRSPLLARTLLVLGLLAGLFAMHGATADHAMAMPAMADHVGVTAAVSSLPSAGAHAEHAASTAEQALAVDSAPDSDDQGMGEACVAVLTGAVLALLLLAGGRSRTANQPDLRRSGSHALPWGRAPPRPPDLVALSVLRI